MTRRLVAQLLASRSTTTDWSVKRVYGLSGSMRPSAGLAAISSAVGGGGGIDQDVAGGRPVLRALTTTT